MIEGHFIVLEGIDGSGTTTQAGELKKRFSKLGLPAHVTAEPTSGPIGGMIRQVLSGRLVMRLHQAAVPFNWKIMSLLFAADRQDHVDAEIVPNLREGVNVICDRYVYSSVVYQSASSADEDAAAWVTTLNRYVKKPDLVLYLKVSPDVAAARCRARDKEMEIYEDPDFQKELAAKYDTLQTLFPTDHIVAIDGDRSAAEVAEACWSHVEKLRSTGAPQ
ncbi:MAG: dTMP kinase [Proteobacteria bacterium]|nr:dTMP kinase [Pseudomonadota bacterium]